VHFEDGATGSRFGGGTQQHLLDGEAPRLAEDDGDDLGGVLGGDLGVAVALLGALPGSPWVMWFGPDWLVPAGRMHAGLARLTTAALFPADDLVSGLQAAG
jgi:hypothetical protein